jgi:hypothetical protein
MSYLRYSCLFGYSGVQHILCYVFLSLVYPMLPVSLDYPFLIAPSVFTNFYSYQFYSREDNHYVHAVNRLTYLTLSRCL